MANNLASHINNIFFSLFIFLLHVGCFMFGSSNKNKTDDNYLPRKRRKSSVPINLSPQKAITSSWSFIKRVFTTTNQTRPMTQTDTTTTTTSFCSPRTSEYSNEIPEFHPRKRRSGSRSEYDSGSLCENPFLPLRNDIYPCPACGEIFHKPSLLEHHQATKHAVSELRDGDSGKNIVWIIYKTGWNNVNVVPKIHRILKIHNGGKILARFEEYRETVKARAARKNAAVSKWDERCIADGNELLRFHCTTFACGLGQNGNSRICNQHYCSACGIIRAGFSPKLDGISTLSSSWRAHVSVPDDVEAEFAFMNVRRAMLVCRVIAGRVGCDPMMMDVVDDKEDMGYDSLVGRSMTGQGKVDDDELLVFNPRAVLPCFLIVYST